MRQFILENQKIKNGLVVLEGKDFRYLRQVLRVKVGDILNVRFKDGTLQQTTVAKIDENSKKITIQICGEAAETSETITRGVQADEINNVLTDREYWLFQFLPKPQKFEQIVRQATECGVLKIIPIVGEYTEKSSVQSLQSSKKERLERVVKEARQQSGSAVPTEVLEPVTLEEALKLWEENVKSCGADECALGAVLSERTEDCIEYRQIIQNREKIKKVAVAVGSEGGISPEEIKKLCEKGLFSPIHFAVNILRCETAALYGIAAVQSALE